MSRVFGSRFRKAPTNRSASWLDWPLPLLILLLIWQCCHFDLPLFGERISIQTRRDLTIDRLDKKVEYLVSTYLLNK